VQWKLHPVFHVDLLTPYRKTEFHGANYDKPPPDLIDGEEEYEVERIVASRRFGRGRKLQYLVKWKGYPDAENQWVAKEDVFAEDAIREFQGLNSDQRTHIRRVRINSDSPRLFSTTSNSAISPVNTEENLSASDKPRAVLTITPAEPMIIPEASYVPPESPSRRYNDVTIPSTAQTPLPELSRLNLSQFDHVMPRRSSQEEVQRWRNQQLACVRACKRKTEPRQSPAT
jgi:hypothetical protein